MLLEKRKLIFDISVLLIIIMILIIIGKNIAAVISPFVISIVIAYLLNPLVSILVKKGLNRVLAILLVFILLLAILIGLFMTFIPRLVGDISVFAENIPYMIDNIDSFLKDFKEGRIDFASFDINSFIDIDQELRGLSDKIKDALAALSSIIIAGTGKLVNAVMIPIITFYFLKDKDEFIALFYDGMPIKIKNHLGRIFKDIDGVIGGFLRGQLIVATFVGILTGLGCRIIGLPYSITIGLLAGVTNIIPYFGPWLGGIVPVLLALMTKPVLVIWVLVVIVVIQQIESNFLSPQIMSQSVGLHPMVVMFSILLFGNMFGVIGMIVGVPIAGTVKVLIKHGMEFRKRLQSD
ncbi:MAG: AI-2E family transporter [Eubacteriales bacterium]